MSMSLDGLVSGLSTSDLIKQLISLERAPQQRLVAKRTAAEKVISTYQALNAKLLAVRDSGAALAGAARWSTMKATSSADAVVTASAGVGALAGSFSFTVGQLAKAGGLASSGTVSSLTAPIVSGALLIPDSTAPALGISGLTGTGLDAGAHTIEVTQASAAAAITAGGALAGSTVIGPGGETLDISINGVLSNLTLTAGTYTADDLVTMLQSQLGPEVVVSKSVTDVLTISTVREGTAATVQIVGGDARDELGFGVDNTVYTGTDAVVDVDGQVNTITSVTDGQSINLTSGTGGTFTADIDTGFRVGTWTGSAIDAGGGTLAEVIEAINDADIGVSAIAVQVSPGQYRLQLNATETGVENDLTFATNLFASTSLGTLLRTQVAQDAEITVGTGPGAYTITSSTNTVSGALEDVTLTLKSTGDATVTVARDAAAIADAVNTFVSVTNVALTDIKNNTAFNSATGTGGILMGNFAVRNLQSRLITAVIDPVVASALQSSSLAGLSTTKEGLLKFDRAKFLAAFEDDPDAVAALFRQGGSADVAGVELESATSKIAAGDYAVVVTTAAERAEVVGNVTAGGVIALAETIDIRLGGATGTTVTYAASAGQSLTSIASALNTLLATEGLEAEVVVEAGAIVVRSEGYGAGSKFEVRSDAVGANQTGLVTGAGAFEEHIGVDVAGTVNGLAATGSGQLLIADSDDDATGGLVFRITSAVPIGAATFTYAPGVAQRLATVSHYATDSVTGTITGLIEGRESEIETWTDRIERWDVQLARREATLRRQFTAMEMALQQSQGQSQWLAGQVASMQANSAASR